MGTHFRSNFSKERSQKHSTHILEKCHEKTHPIFCSAFQNVTLDHRIPETPKRRIIASYYLLNHPAKLLQKIIASQKHQTYRSYEHENAASRFKDVHTGTKRRLDVKTRNRDAGISGHVANTNCAISRPPPRLQHRSHSSMRCEFPLNHF